MLFKNSKRPRHHVSISQLLEQERIMRENGSGRYINLQPRPMRDQQNPQQKSA